MRFTIKKSCSVEEAKCMLDNLWQASRKKKLQYSVTQGALRRDFGM